MDRMSHVLAWCRANWLCRHRPVAVLLAALLFMMLLCVYMQVIAEDYALCNLPAQELNDTGR